MCRNDELSSMMSWVGCLLKDSELFTLFSENSQILLKNYIIPILLTFVFLVVNTKQPTQVIVELNSLLRHITVTFKRSDWGPIAKPKLARSLKVIVFINIFFVFNLYFWIIPLPTFQLEKLMYWDNLRKAGFTSVLNWAEIFCNYFKDGKITKKEWLMMWKTYKKEISEKEKEQKDFLRNYYRHSLRIHLGNSTDGEKKENFSAEVIYDSSWPKSNFDTKLFFNQICHVKF